MCYGSGGGKLETGTREGHWLNGLACSPGFGQQKMYMEGGSQARAGGDAINKCLGSILAAPRMGWGWARAHGKAPARGRCGRPESCNCIVIGGVNTYHLRAPRRGFWGLVVFPRFASVRRTTAAADIGGGGALSAPLCSSCRVTVQKKTPIPQPFLKSPELKLQLQLRDCVKINLHIFGFIAVGITRVNIFT
jgi:hypothetical protein